LPERLLRKTFHSQDGIEIRLHTTVGKDVSRSLSQSFDTVFLAGALRENRRQHLQRAEENSKGDDQVNFTSKPT
jgi:hypothetical protein